MYFLKADDLQRPVCLIMCSGVPRAAKSEARPILNEWVLYFRGGRPNRAKQLFSCFANQSLCTGVPSGPKKSGPSRAQRIRRYDERCLIGQMLGLLEAGSSKFASEAECLYDLKCIRADGGSESPSFTSCKAMV